MAATVTITYEDGRQDAIRILPLGLVAAERHFKGANIPAIEGTLYAAWYLLKPGSDFEEWMSTLVDIDEKGEEPVPPTQPDQPPEQ